MWEAVSDIEVAERAKVVAMAKQVRSELQQWMDEVQVCIS